MNSNFIMQALHLFNLILALIVITSFLLPWIKKGYWWIRLFDFPRFHFFIIGLYLITFYYKVLFSNTFDTLFFLVLGIFLITLNHAILIFPFTRLASREVYEVKDNDEGDFISAIVANIKYQNQKYEDFLELVNKEKPSFVAIIEYNQAWKKGVKELIKTYPYVVEEVKEDGCGLALFSKFEITNSRVRFVLSPKRPSIRATLKISDNNNVDVIILHPAPPGLLEASGSRKGSRPRDAELMLIAKELREFEQPVIVIGDFNDAAWSHTTRLFKRISGILDVRVGRGFYNTYPAKYSFFQVPIDHVFVSAHFLISILKITKIKGSDHLGIYFNLLLIKKADSSDVSSPKKGDIQEAKNLIKSGIKEAHQNNNKKD